MKILSRFADWALQQGSFLAVKRMLLRTLAGVLVAVLPTVALAGPFGLPIPFTWQVVELPTASGASCGNGTPYRFFVNRSPFTKDMVVAYEGGGACFDQESCQGIGSQSATNPNGISKGYLWEVNTAVNARIIPMTDRLGIFAKIRTQGWDMVYLPYCTGDTHAGSATRVLADKDPKNPRVQRFAGQQNIREAAKWIRANMGQPHNLMVTGFSAGSLGATVTYPIMRDALAPTGRASLVADSALQFSAPKGGNIETFPGIKASEQAHSFWGLNEKDVGVFSRVYGGIGGFDPNNAISVYPALASKYKNDRFSYIHFSMDRTMSRYYYKKHFPGITDENIYAKLSQDLATWRLAADQMPSNVGYYIPHFRDLLGSHCATVGDFSSTGIEELNIKDVKIFIDNTLDRGQTIRAFETDKVSDFFRPISPILAFLNSLFP